MAVCAVCERYKFHILGEVSEEEYWLQLIRLPSKTLKCSFLYMDRFQIDGQWVLVQIIVVSRITLLVEPYLPKVLFL